MHKILNTAKYIYKMSCKTVTVQVFQFLSMQRLQLSFSMCNQALEHKSKFMFCFFYCFCNPVIVFHILVWVTFFYFASVFLRLLLVSDHINNPGFVWWWTYSTIKCLEITYIVIRNYTNLKKMTCGELKCIISRNQQVDLVVVGDNSGAVQFRSPVWLHDAFFWQF